MFMTNALMPAWCQAIPRTYADILKAIYQGAFLCKKSIVKKYMFEFSNILLLKYNKNSKLLIPQEKLQNRMS